MLQYVWSVHEEVGVGVLYVLGLGPKSAGKCRRMCGSEFT